MNFVNRWFFSEANKSSWAVQFNEILTELEIVLNGNLDSTNFTSTALDKEQRISFLFDSFLIDEEIFATIDSFVGNVTKIGLELGENADAAVTVDILKDDVEQSKIATLTANTKQETTTLATTEFHSNKFALKIKSIGSDSAPGQSLTATIFYTI